jgi:hypothetical protein
LNPDHPASSFPSIMIGHGLQVYLPPCSIMASKCISKCIRSLPPNSSPTLLNHSLQLNLWVYPISLSPSASPTSSIPASKCISQFIHSQSPSAWPNTLNHRLQVYHPGGTAGVQRYKRNGGGQSDGVYILGRPRST